MAKKEGKIVIVGAGFVGSTIAYALLIEGIASEIILLDIHKEKAEGEALDLKHSLQFTAPTKIVYGDNFQLCRDAAIIIICAGAHQKPGETRLDLVQKNAKIFKAMIPNITKYNKDCILIVVTNPLDVLTYLTLKYSKFKPNKVFGSGTILDTARFRYLLGEYFNVDPSSVHAYILGEHGDSEFPVWSTANIAGIHLSKLDNYNKKAMNGIFKKTKNAAYEVIAKKGATYYAIGLGIAKIVKAVLRNHNEVLPVSTLLKDYYGISGVCLSVPCIVNKDGIKKQLKLPLNNIEKKMLKKSADIIRGYIKKIE